jgi:heterogeneous nuclear ribonucleoprotein U-like protein 1
MQPFKGFNRVAVVVVPSEEDLKTRTELQAKEEGKAVPNNSVLEMKGKLFRKKDSFGVKIATCSANFVVPTKGDIFEEVRFVELGEEEATKMIEQYVKEANAAGVFKKDDSKHARFEQKPNFAGYRSNSGNTNSRYHSGNSNSRYGSGGGGGGGGGGGDFRNQRFQGGGGGGGGFPRRDNREG